MLEWFCLGELWKAVQASGPIKSLVGAVILVLAVLQLVAWCSEIVRLWLQP